MGVVKTAAAFVARLDSEKVRQGEGSPKIDAQCQTFGCA